MQIQRKYQFPNLPKNKPCLASFGIKWHHLAWVKTAVIQLLLPKFELENGFFIPAKIIRLKADYPFTGKEQVMF